MKILALVPDPRTAYELGAALAALPRASLQVVAYGQATAAALPLGLDVLVYPIREGTRLPAPFLEALVRHLNPAVLLAPAGAVRVALAPTLLLDLNPSIPVADIAPTGEGDHTGWIEAVTTDAERRRELLRAGLFAVELSPALFCAPGRLAREAAVALKDQLTDMANLTVPHSSPERASAPAAPPIMAGPPATPAPPSGGRTIAAPTAVALDSLDPLGVETSPAADATAAAQPGPPDETQSPEQHRGRCAGRRALILAAPAGLEGLTPADLAQATVVAVPEALPWLHARMGVAQYVCATTAPRTADAASALANARTVFVHAAHIDGVATAPRARARVALQDLARAGWPGVGWSDELGAGFFPAAGDAALALQWAAWLEASEIVLAGAGPLTSQPDWSSFWRGATELLEGRGVEISAFGPAQSDAAPTERPARPPHAELAAR